MAHGGSDLSKSWENTAEEQENCLGAFPILGLFVPIC